MEIIYLVYIKIRILNIKYIHLVPLTIYQS